MSDGAVAAIAGAVLVFWMIGAYNRLVRLRGAIGQAYAQLDTHLTQRHDLLGAWADARATEPGAPPLDTLLAARSQAAIAAEHARHRPADAATVKSLALAEAALQAARSSMTDADAATAAWPAPLTATDNAVDYARGLFNDAALAYNRAARQFPTRIVARIFGFRPAGVL